MDKERNYLTSIDIIELEQKIAPCSFLGLAKLATICDFDGDGISNEHHHGHKDHGSKYCDDGHKHHGYKDHGSKYCDDGHKDHGHKHGSKYCDDGHKDHGHKHGSKYCDDGHKDHGHKHGSKYCDDGHKHHGHKHGSKYCDDGHKDHGHKHGSKYCDDGHKDHGHKHHGHKHHVHCHPAPPACPPPVDPPCPPPADPPCPPPVDPPCPPPVDPPCPPPVDPPCPPPVEPPCPPPEVVIPECSEGIYGDPHIDMITKDTSVVEFDHHGYSESQYTVFKGDDMIINATYQEVGDAPEYINNASISVNGYDVNYSVDGSLTINGESISQPGQYDIGNNGYVQLNEDNQLGEHSLELHNDQDSRVDFWTNGTEMKIDPSGTYIESTVGGLLGDTFLENQIPAELANASTQEEAYLVIA